MMQQQMASYAGTSITTELIQKVSAMFCHACDVDVMFYLCSGMLFIVQTNVTNDFSEDFELPLDGKTTLCFVPCE